MRNIFFYDLAQKDDSGEHEVEQIESIVIQVEGRAALDIVIG